MTHPDELKAAIERVEAYLDGYDSGLLVYAVPLTAMRALIDAARQADDAYVRGFAAGQAAMPKGTLTVVESLETIALRAERDAWREAALAERERHVTTVRHMVNMHYQQRLDALDSALSLPAPKPKGLT